MGSNDDDDSDEQAPSVAAHKFKKTAAIVLFFLLQTALRISLALEDHMYKWSLLKYIIAKTGV